MKKRIILNDQGLYVDCTNENGIISFEFEKKLSTLNNKVTISKEGNTLYGVLGIKKILMIQNDKIIKIVDITSTELRILCALSNRVDYLSSMYNINTSILDEFNKMVKELSLPRKWNEKQIHKTELHTHFLEILNPREFVDFINKYGVTYPIDEEGNLDFKNGKNLTYDELVSLGYENKLLNSLRLDVSSQSSFDELTQNVIYIRNELLQRIIKYNQDIVIASSSLNTQEFDDLDYYIDDLMHKMSREEINKLNISKKEKSLYRDKLNTELSRLLAKKRNAISNVLYDELLKVSLEKLSFENIEYSEISFSNEKRLEYFSDRYSDDNRFNLLYSIDRTNSIDDFMKSSNTLERLLNTEKVIGVDIMGNEKPLMSEEYGEFKNKIPWLLPVLHIHPNSVLRIHASEFVDATDNMLNTLKIIDELSNEINKDCITLFGKEWGIIPPPRIRIGHGVNINKNPELIDLIKKYDVVVEINASSNYALGHIKSLDDIPIDYYKKNKIKYVISTDGGGVYSTSIHQEENLFNKKYSDEESLQVENEQINHNGIEDSSQSDKELYEKYRIFQEETIKEKTYLNFMEALEYERSICKNDKELISEEIKDLSRYIMDNDLDYDRDYYRKMIDIITKFNNNTKSDISKIFLYLMEKELFPRRKTLLRSVEYLDGIKNNKEINDNLELSLVKLFKVIKEEYKIVSYEINKYVNLTDKNERSY